MNLIGIRNEGKDNMSDRKFGEGSLRAFMRQGLKEVAQVLPAFKDSMHIVEEPGQIGNPTTYDVSKQTGAVEVKREPEPEMEP